MSLAAPPAAAGLFGARLALAERFHSSLESAGPIRGLNGPREIPVLWDRHLINSALLAHLPDDMLPSGARVVDLGSGAGLPGIPLAIARPDLSITLVDPLQRRITYLHEIVGELGLSNIRVVRARSGDEQSVTDIGRHDVVTSRALAPLGRLLHWSVPHIAPNGRIIAMKGRRAEEEIEALSRSERALVSTLDIHDLRTDDHAHHARVIVARPRSVKG